MHMNIRQAAASISMFASALVLSPAHAAYDIPQHVIAGGGGTSSSGAYVLTGTIGQSVLGQSSGGNYIVNGGFWGGGAVEGGLFDILVNVSLSGSGSPNSSVASTPTGISCPPTCNLQFNQVASVSLAGTPAGGSAFIGWLGPCTGNGTCVIDGAGTKNVTGTFALTSPNNFRLDIDLNGQYDPLTDGLLVVRYLFGLTGPALTTHANAGAMNDQAILGRLIDLKPLLDIDGDGRADPWTDGMLLVRYLAGIRGSELIAGAINLSAAKRTTATAIANYIQPLLPP